MKTSRMNRKTLYSPKIQSNSSFRFIVYDMEDISNGLVKYAGKIGDRYITCDESLKDGEVVYD